MGNKGNPRRQLRSKLIILGIGVLVLILGFYAQQVFAEQSSNLEKQEKLIHEYQQELVEQGSLIDQHKETLSTQQGEISDLNEKVNILNTSLDKKKIEQEKAKKSHDEKVQELKDALATKKANEARKIASANKARELALAQEAKKKTEQTVVAQVSPTPKQVSTPTHKVVSKPTVVATTKVASVSTPKVTSISRGTSESGREITVSATAYTAYCYGCSGVTATGIDLRANPSLKVIAVDPSVIPLGSKVWVEGYGHAIAGDTGGAIKGMKIDIFMSDKQAALSWGRKTITIKVLN